MTKSQVFQALDRLLDRIEQRADLLHHVGAHLEHPCIEVVADDVISDVAAGRKLLAELEHPAVAEAKAS